MWFHYLYITVDIAWSVLYFQIIKVRHRQMECMGDKLEYNRQMAKTEGRRKREQRKTEGKDR